MEFQIVTLSHSMPLCQRLFRHARVQWLPGWLGEPAQRFVLGPGERGSERRRPSACAPQPTISCARRSARRPAIRAGAHPPPGRPSPDQLDKTPRPENRFCHCRRGCTDHVDLAITLARRFGEPDRSHLRLAIGHPRYAALYDRGRLQPAIPRPPGSPWRSRGRVGDRAPGHPRHTRAGRGCNHTESVRDSPRSVSTSRFSSRAPAVRTTRTRVSAQRFALGERHRDALGVPRSPRSPAR